jgi:hypothetical protein
VGNVHTRLIASARWANRSLLNTCVANPGAAQADAHFHLAVLYVTGATGKADYSRALQHFNSASHAGHLMAVYNLALMHLTGLGIPVSCPTALALLKSVAERGLWSQVLQRAHAAFLQVRTALLRVSIPLLCVPRKSKLRADFHPSEDNRSRGERWCVCEISCGVVRSYSLTQDDRKDHSFQFIFSTTRRQIRQILS